MQDLIKEYRQSLRTLRGAKVVPMEHHSMVSDTQYAIEVMETGRIPGTKWTIARWPLSKREVLVDPFVLSCLAINRKPAEPAPEELVSILDVVLQPLTQREREAYRLVRGEKFSFGQAAQLMGCTKATAQTFVRRAEKKIKVVIRKQTYSEGVC